MATLAASVDFNATVTGGTASEVVSVTVAGVHRVGQTVTASVTMNPADAAFSVKWQRETDPDVWVDISGANGPSYTYVDDDDEETVRALATPADGGDALGSTGQRVIYPQPEAIVGPTMTPATSTVGDTLTFTLGTWGPEVAVSYVILNAAGTQVDSGSTGGTYVTQTSGVHRLRVTGTSSGGPTVEEVSVTVEPEEGGGTEPITVYLETFGVAEVVPAEFIAPTAPATLLPPDPTILDGDGNQIYPLGSIYFLGNSASFPSMRFRYDWTPGRRALVYNGQITMSGGTAVGRRYFAYLNASNQVIGSEITVSDYGAINQSMAFAPEGTAKVQIRFEIRGSNVGNTRMRIRKTALYDITDSGGLPVYTARIPTPHCAIMAPGEPLTFDYGPTWEAGANGGQITGYTYSGPGAHSWDGSVLTVTHAAAFAGVQSGTVRAFYGAVESTQTASLSMRCEAIGTLQALAREGRGIFDVSIEVGQWIWLGIHDFWSGGLFPYTFAVVTAPSWLVDQGNGNMSGVAPAAPQAAAPVTIRITDARGVSVDITRQVTVIAAYDRTITHTATTGTLRNALPGSLSPTTRYVVRVPNGVTLDGTPGATPARGLSGADFRRDPAYPVIFRFEPGSRLVAGSELDDCAYVFLEGTEPEALAITRTSVGSNPVGTKYDGMLRTVMLKVAGGSRVNPVGPCFVRNFYMQGAGGAATAETGLWNQIKRHGVGSIYGTAGARYFRPKRSETDPEEIYWRSLPALTSDDPDGYGTVWYGAGLHPEACLIATDGRITRVTQGIKFDISYNCGVRNVVIDEMRMDYIRTWSQTGSCGIENVRNVAATSWTGGHGDDEHNDLNQCGVNAQATYANRYVSMRGLFMRCGEWPVVQGWQSNPVTANNNPTFATTDPRTITRGRVWRDSFITASLNNGTNIKTAVGHLFDGCVFIVDPDAYGGTLPVGRAGFRWTDMVDGTMRNTLHCGVVIERSGYDRHVTVENCVNLRNVIGGPATVFPNWNNTAAPFDDPRLAVAAGQSASVARFWIDPLGGWNTSGLNSLVGPAWLRTGTE